MGAKYVMKSCLQALHGFSLNSGKFFYRICGETVAILSDISFLSSLWERMFPALKISGNPIEMSLQA